MIPMLRRRTRGDGKGSEPGEQPRPDHAGVPALRTWTTCIMPACM
jgi:hypothetical protein